MMTMLFIQEEEGRGWKKTSSGKLNNTIYTIGQRINPVNIVASKPIKTGTPYFINPKLRTFQYLCRDIPLI